LEYKVLIRIGITGQSGFIGQHLYRTLSLQASSFLLIPFEKSIFDSHFITNTFEYFYKFTYNNFLFLIYRFLYNFFYYFAQFF